MFLIPDFKGYDFFPHGSHLDFMRFKGLCLSLSAIAMVASFLAIALMGFNYGVDFMGGTLIEVRSTDGPADIQDIRAKLSQLDLGDVQIQSLDRDDVLIRIEHQSGGSGAEDAAMETVLKTLGENFEPRRTEIVGPAVSSELWRNGILALVGSLIAIVVYVWFRFDWQFALGSIVALAHDVFLVAGIFALFQLEFDLSIVAALLTVLGYSVNDTVVVSDRIRENLRRYKRMSLDDLLNLSINETLSRTILTGATTLVVLVALLVFGGDVLFNFSLAMLLGVVIGTYSSVFLAAPLLGYLGIRRETFGAPAAADQKPAEPAPEEKQYGSAAE
jgi:preprotein translocase SecF subunit